MSRDPLTAEEHTHPSEAHRAACPACNPDRTVPELNAQYARTSNQDIRRIRKTIEHYARTEEGRAPADTVSELRAAAEILQALERGQSETNAAPAERLAVAVETHLRIIDKIADPSVPPADARAAARSTLPELVAALDAYRGTVKALAARACRFCGGEHDPPECVPPAIG